MRIGISAEDMRRPGRTLQWWAWAVLALAMLCGCAKAPEQVPLPPAPVQPVAPAAPQPPPDVFLDAPQRVSLAVPLTDVHLLTTAEQAVLHDRALTRFFAPWDLKKASLPAHDAFWGVAAYGAKQGYAENLQPYPRERWERLVALQAMDSYPSMAEPAIITRNTAQRVLPSLRPFFLDPELPGEGFPFDYFQNSALWLGTPVLVTHATLDRAWLFVESALASGWVRSEDVALADENFRNRYRSRSMAAVTGDDTPLAETGNYLGQAHIGAIFPIHSRRGDGLTVTVPLRDADGRAQAGLAALDSGQAAPMPMPLTARAMAGLAEAMDGQLYGWGGMYENRDCSSTLRDLFLPFGVWLPRNSSQQAKQAGTMIALDGMDAEEKLAIIRAKGVPFASFIWMPGHIGLYLGCDSRGEPLLLHNIWGVRTRQPDGREGRAVIGRLVISTLRPGEGRDDVKEGSFLNRVGGLTVIGTDANGNP